MRSKDIIQQILFPFDQVFQRRFEHTRQDNNNNIGDKAMTTSHLVLGPGELKKGGIM